jgi:hypothetical protein
MAQGQFDPRTGKQTGPAIFTLSNVTTICQLAVAHAVRDALFDKHKQLVENDVKGEALVAAMRTAAEEAGVGKHVGVSWGQQEKNVSAAIGRHDSTAIVPLAEAAQLGGGTAAQRVDAVRNTGATGAWGQQEGNLEARAFRSAPLETIAAMAGSLSAPDGLMSARAAAMTAAAGGQGSRAINFALGGKRKRVGTGVSDEQITGDLAMSMVDTAIDAHSWMAKLSSQKKRLADPRTLAGMCGMSLPDFLEDQRRAAEFFAQRAAARWAAHPGLPVMPPSAPEQSARVPCTFVPTTALHEVCAAVHRLCAPAAPA